MDDEKKIQVWMKAQIELDKPLREYANMDEILDAIVAAAKKNSFKYDGWGYVNPDQIKSVIDDLNLTNIREEDIEEWDFYN